MSNADEKWRRIDRLLERALELAPDEREAFLRAREDPAERDELRRLLDLAERADDLLESGAALERSLGVTGDSRAPTTESRRPFSSGQILAARYRLDQHVGAGGMGAVFRARDLKLDRDVAVKLVEAGGVDAQWRERLLREARAAAALNHPNIVAIYDAGDEQGVPFLVMEYVDGKTLEQDPPSDLERLRNVACQICDALEHAHSRGIVHRDLKPANLLVLTDKAAATGHATIKLADLGIALARDQNRLTDRRAMVGTPHYMAPEQATGGTIDARTDLYALGVMLYQWCTGKLPFSGDNVLGVVSQHIHAPLVAPREHRSDLSEALDATICRLLAKDAAGRFGSAAEVKRALESAFGDDDALEISALAPPTATPALPTVPLPRPRTRLIGRQAERDTIQRLVVDEGVRLITLTGPGGSGKTRLALQVAEDLGATFGRRVVFVPLAAIHDAQLVGPAIARGLGVRGAGSSTDVIVRELGANPEPVLLILDNFEQVMEAAAGIGELLTGMPTLTVVVTSRELLRLYGEHDVPVLPLEVPRGENLPSLAELERCSAVALFTERARASNPKFRLTAENAAAVAELCARLDGLPLALELAAARVRLLSPKAMLTRLQSRLELLTSGARDLPDRQRTLRGALDWSYDLIEDAEKDLFRRLGVFAGGFTLEAAEAVCDSNDDLTQNVVDSVSSLVDKSLLQRDDRSTDEPRFAMLETIREYARDKLTVEEDATARRAHSAYYLILAEDGSTGLAGGDEARWLAIFAREHDNFREALRWLTERREVEWGLRMTLALFRFWERSGHLVEGRRRFEALLALEESHANKPLRARALFSCGVLVSGAGDRVQACGYQEQSLQLHRELGDDRGVAVALNGVAIGLTERREYATAYRYIHESLDIWQRLGDDVGYARSLSNLAFVVKMQDDPVQARKMYERAVTLFEKAGDKVGAAWAINHQADVAVGLGDLEDAWRINERALAAFRALDDSWGIATCQADMGIVEARRGEDDRASVLYRAALERFAALEHKPGIARLLESLGCAAAAQGRPRHGLTLLAAADTLRVRIATPAPNAEEVAQRITSIRETLGSERAEATWREGGELGLDQAVRLALEPAAADPED